MHAALCFPSFPGFGGGVFQRAKDKELALACVQAWNDFQLDEWCATAPDRLIPLAILPTWDPHLAAAEVERVAEGRPGDLVPRRARPARAAVVPHRPLGAGCGRLRGHRDAGVPALRLRQLRARLLVLAQPMSSIARRAPFAVAISAVLHEPRCGPWPTSLFSGMLQRHPEPEVHARPRAASAGFPTCWSASTTPGSGTAGTRTSTRRRRPSDLFRKHFWGCFIDDVHGVETGTRSASSNILIEVDYPHSDSNWPNSRKRMPRTSPRSPMTRPA